MHNTRYRHRVRQQFRRLSHLAIFIQRIKIPRIQIRVPITHIHQNLLNLRLREGKFLEEPPTAQVMVIFVALAQDIAYVEMGLVVVCPVLFAAVDGDSAVGTLEVYVCGRRALLAGFAGFEVEGAVRGAGGLVIRVRAVCVLAHEGCAFAHLGYGGIGEGVEEVLLVQHECPLGSFGVDIFKWFPALPSFLGCGGGETAARQGERGFGGGFSRVIPRYREVLGDETEGGVRAQLGSRSFDQ